MMIRYAMIAAFILRLDNSAYAEDLQLKPQYYVQALQQQSAACAEENVRLKGAVLQYVDEVADLRKRLAEAEAKARKTD